ncbi:MAG TPA: hypothetical protein VMF61_12645, partial [Candidatus Acidoferrales bacterium]|nr:hypothetical protein [Candidatus Acidoferrales bacterium]
PSPKRKWSRVTSQERRTCETPGCETLARERCKQFNCNQQHCEKHKGGHSAIHTLLQKRGLTGPTRGRSR